VGAILFWIVQLSLLYGFGLPLVDSILLAALLVAVPALAVAQVPLVKGLRVERLPAYWGSIATLWLLGTASWLVGTRAGGPTAVGLLPLPGRELATWSIGLTLGALALILVFRQMEEWTGAEESRLLRVLIPRTPREKAVFALLSLAAGVCEEVAYRGYAMTALSPLLGSAGALGLTSIVFGALHGYQGWIGTVRTALMGALLGWGFLVTGSLWPAIVAHTAIDLLAGIVLAERLLPPPEPPGVMGALAGSAEASTEMETET
jgi:membrane protease YdiL (CAAX protease family)